jgi:hypothetical protein
VNRIPPEQKTGFLRCSAYFEYGWSKNQTVCSLENSPRWSSSPWNTLLKRAVNLRRSNLSSPPAFSYHHAGANCSVGNPSPRENPGLKRTRTDAILKKFNQIMNLKF